jgi:hypothetical protein
LKHRKATKSRHSKGGKQTERKRLRDTRRKTEQDRVPQQASKREHRRQVHRDTELQNEAAVRQSETKENKKPRGTDNKE